MLNDFARHAFLIAGFALLGASASAAAEVVAEGTWTKKSYAIEGGWKIEAEGETHYVLLDDAFKTKKAPDLKIFLSPVSLDAVDDRNATDGSLLVGPLTSAQGAQRLAIPAGTDLDTYRTILIHCEKYSKLWGGSALR